MIVPDLGVNLLSVAKLAEKGTIPGFSPKDPYLMAKGRRTDLTFERGLYCWRVKAVVDQKDPGAQENNATAHLARGSADLWHKRLGHRSLDAIPDKESFGIEVLKGSQSEVPGGVATCTCSESPSSWGYRRHSWGIIIRVSWGCSTRTEVRTH